MDRQDKETDSLQRICQEVRTSHPGGKPSWVRVFQSDAANGAIERSWNNYKWDYGYNTANQDLVDLIVSSI